MTPSLTFQWPLSPGGTFQPLRSLPLNSDTNPSGAALSSARSPRAAAQATAAAKTKWRRCMLSSSAVAKAASGVPTLRLIVRGGPGASNGTDAGLRNDPYRPGESASVHFLAAPVRNCTGTDFPVFPLRYESQPDPDAEARGDAAQCVYGGVDLPPRLELA